MTKPIIITFSVIKKHLSEDEKNYFFMTFNRHVIWQLFSKNLEFPIFLIISCHFQFSLDFSFSIFSLSVNLGLLIGGLGKIIWFLNHSPPISIKMVCLYLLKSSGVGFFLPYGFFEKIFYLILIGHSNSWNIPVQYVNPKVNESCINKNKNKEE